MVEYLLSGRESKEDAQKRIDNYSPETGSHTLLAQDILIATYGPATEISESDVERVLQENKNLALDKKDRLNDLINILVMMGTLKKLS